LSARLWIRLLLVCIAAGSAVPAPVSSAVRVIEGEVIFTVRAPKAKRVFLAGDFNNWNPEVEEMVKEGDTFEWSLFLVAGEYRYKFVVDGQWINDPDNIPEDPQLGSQLVLVETPRGLQLKDVDEQGRPIGTRLRPSLRYIGRFAYEDEEADADQRMDVNVEVNDKAYSAAALFRSRDDSWELSPLRADIFFDRGRFDAQVWKCRLTAFENDTIWTSSDPFALIGPRGIYRYNEGFGRRGLALDLPITGGIEVKALFADKPAFDSFGAFPAVGAVRESALRSMQGDSVRYSYRVGNEGSDVWGVEALVHLGNYRAGFVRRADKGLHAGRLNTMQPLDTLFENAVYRTDESWEADAFWIAGKIYGPLNAKLAYGRGNAYLNRRRRTAAVADVPTAIDPGLDAVRWDARQKVQESRRWLGIVDVRQQSFHGALAVDYADYTFDSPVFTASEADVIRFGFDASYIRAGWTGSLHLDYVDQDYGNTPPSFYIDSPERNYWLRGGDGFRPETMVIAGLESYSMLRLTVANGPRMFFPGDDPKNDDAERRLRIFLQAGMDAGGMMEWFEYGYVRAAIERSFYEGFYGQLDARGALYDNLNWRDGAFLSSYVEAGYRNHRMEISLGFGFDPVVLDPVRNEYEDIGRTEYLRKALGGMFTRGAGYNIMRGLLDLEHKLETDRTVKLECIVEF